MKKSWMEFLGPAIVFPCVREFVWLSRVFRERLVYKKRGESPPMMGTPALLPKRMMFLVDISGSMYRFNGLVVVFNV